jgi:Tfp pilus assembly protein PilN
MSAPLYQQVNLYQPIFRRQRQIFSALMMLQVTGVVAAALLAIYVYGAWQLLGLEAEAVQLEGREKAYSTQLARLDPTSSTQRRRDVEQEIREINARLVDQQRLIDILQAQPLGGTEGFSAQLAALARRHLNGLWLTELRIRGASRSLELVGKTIEPGLVPEYLLGLGNEDALAGQRFEQMQIERAADGGEISFRVTGREVSDTDSHTKLVRR